jgi:hypothetical protein
VAVKKTLLHDHNVFDNYFLSPPIYVDFGDAVGRIDLVVVNHANFELVHPPVYTEMNCFLFAFEVGNLNFSPTFVRCLASISCCAVLSN